jgi:hypothetical protein
MLWLVRERVPALLMVMGRGFHSFPFHSVTSKLSICRDKRPVQSCFVVTGGGQYVVDHPAVGPFVFEFCFQNYETYHTELTSTRPFTLSRKQSNYY